MSSSSDETPEEIQSDKQDKPAISLGDCLVCGHPAHGLHFGVLACRACAAFYRRSVVAKRKFKCRRNGNACQITKDDRYICRFCRYQKCLSLGMQDDNVQWSKVERTRRQQDIHLNSGGITSASESSPSSTPSFHPNVPTGSGSTERSREQRSAFVTGNAEDRQRFLTSLGLIKQMDVNEHDAIDTTLLKERIEYIFANPPHLPVVGVKMSIMQRMLLGLHHLRRNQNQNPQVLLFVDGASARAAWEWQMSAMAMWAMYLEEFCALPAEEKMAVYKSTRGAFHRLERIHQTLCLYGTASTSGLPDPVVYVISPDHVIDVAKSQFEFSYISDYGNEEINSMFMPFRSRIVEEVALPMSELRLTDTELAFMLGQLVWHLEGKAVSRETKAVARSVRLRMANEIHDHYTHEMRMANYAGRLQVIMGIVNDIENIIFERDKMMDLAKIFDVFTLENVNMA